MYNEVVVVEGKNDKARLLAIFPKLNVIITNGSEISEETLNMIEKLAVDHKIILFLDPDYPGERIRNKILKRVPNCDNVFLEKKKAIDYRKHKVGIEHATNEDIIDALKHKISYNNNKETITINDLYRLGLIGHELSVKKREYIATILHIGNPNGKTLLKRLNYLQIDAHKLEEILNEKDWNC